MHFACYALQSCFFKKCCRYYSLKLEVLQIIFELNLLFWALAKLMKYEYRFKSKLTYMLLAVLNSCVFLILWSYEIQISFKPFSFFIYGAITYLEIFKINSQYWVSAKSRKFITGILSLNHTLYLIISGLWNILKKSFHCYFNCLQRCEVDPQIIGFLSSKSLITSIINSLVDYTFGL